MYSPELGTKIPSKLFDTVQIAYTKSLGIDHAAPKHPDIKEPEVGEILGMPISDTNAPQHVLVPEQNEQETQIIEAAADADTTDDKRTDKKRRPKTATHSTGQTVLLPKPNFTVDPTFDDLVAGAPCADNPDLFFPNRKTEKKVIAASKAICAVCDVRVVCGKYAIDKGIPAGTWGGITQWERKEIFKKRAIEMNRAKLNQ